MRLIAAQPKLQEIPQHVLQEHYELINIGFDKVAPRDIFDGPRLFAKEEIIESVEEGWLIGVYDCPESSELDITKIETFNSSQTLGRLIASTNLVFEKSMAENVYYKIKMLAVDPDFWYCGIGTKLMAACEQFIFTTLQAELKPHTCITVVEVVLDAGHQGYYESRGFTTVESMMMPAGTWDARRPFTLLRMERPYGATSL
jgi:N-acetylglutamate synthase-like GNAT family acetyltransferase